MNARGVLEDNLMFVLASDDTGRVQTGLRGGRLEDYLLLLLDYLGRVDHSVRGVGFEDDLRPRRVLRGPAASRQTPEH